MKRIAVVIMVSMAALAAAAYTTLYFYDFNKLKPRVERAALDSTGRKLSIEEMAFKIGLRPGVVLKDVAFENAPWGSRPHMAKAGWLEVKVALIPLLFKEVRIKKLVIADADILIEKNPSGKPNYIFELRKKKNQRISLDTLLVENATIVYRDGVSGKTGRLAVETLSVSPSLGAGLKTSVKGLYGETPFEASAELRYSWESFDLRNLDASFGPLRINGSVAADLKGKRPYVTAKLQSKRLVFPSGEKKVEKERVFPSTPLPRDYLKRFDGEMKFSSSEVTAGKMALKDLSMELSLKDGSLSVKPIKAMVGGGGFEGAIAVKPYGDGVLVSSGFKAKDIKLEKILEKKEGTRVEGSFDAQGSLKGHGKSVAQIMATLDGTLGIVAGKGSIDNKYFAILGADIGTALMRLLYPSAKKETAVDINCMVCRFAISDGIAESEAMVFDTTLMSVVGIGEIDLRRERLNISFKPVPKEALGAGRFGMSFTELSRPFKLGGTLARPSLAIASGATALMVGKALGAMALVGPAGIAAVLVGERGVEGNPCLKALEKTQKEEEKGAVEKLKGLFGR
jgi:uncharacterized protein involved in outer membrane biogenesis